MGIIEAILESMASIMMKTKAHLEFSENLVVNIVTYLIFFAILSQK